MVGLRRATLVVLAAALIGCGPTAEAIITPGPTAQAGSPAGPTAPTPTDSGSGQPPASATPPATTGSPSAGPAASPAGSGFTRLAEFPAAGAYEVTGVTVTRAGFLAVGFGALPGEDYFGRRQGITWTSADGMSWLEMVDPSLEFVTPLRIAARGNDAYMLGLLATCPQIFEDPCPETPEAGNGIWRSIAGGAWERLPVPPEMQLGLIDAITFVGDQLIVTGSAGDELQTSTVWRSADGASWSATSEVGGLDPVSAIGAGPSGLVAFGTSFVAELEHNLVTAATSPEGATFTPAVVPEVFDAAISSIVAGSNGLVAVGYGETDSLALVAIALHSVDGLAWAQATSSDGSFDDGGLVEVHALDAGYFAIGFEPDPDDFLIQTGATWYSADGLTWQSHILLDGTFTQFSASALGPGGLVIFTADQEEFDDETVNSVINAWFAPTAALIP